MQTLREFRQKLKRKNQNRLKYLQAKFKNYSDENLDDHIADELRGLMNVNELVKHEIDENMHQSSHVGIRTSKQEIWYRDVLIAWLKQHPETGIDTDKAASLYRFTLTFFVNQVILNPKNNTLSYGDLLKGMDEINDVDPMLNQINNQMADLKEMTSFIAAMDYLENMQDFGPARQIDEVIQTDIRSEIDESSQYAKDYHAYQKRRKNDLSNKRQRRRGEGMEFKHD